METIRVLICGSRDWIDRESIQTILRGHLEDANLVIIDGKAAGAVPTYIVMEA